MRKKRRLILIGALYIFALLARTHLNIHPWQLEWVAWITCRDFIVGCFVWYLKDLIYERRGTKREKATGDSA